LSTLHDETFAVRLPPDMANWPLSRINVETLFFGFLPLDVVRQPAARLLCAVPLPLLFGTPCFPPGW